MISPKPKMNRKFLSVFFCVLVSSTLGHEILKAHEISHHFKRSHGLGFHQDRAATLPPSCSYVCPAIKPAPEYPSDAGLELLRINEKIFAFVNVTSLSSLVFEVGESIVVLLNGKTGLTIYIDIKSEQVIYSAAGSNTNQWLREKILLTDYLENLVSLNVILHWKNIQTFKLKSIPKQVLSDVVNISKDLSSQIAERVKSNPDSIISILTVIVVNLRDASGVLKFILGKLDSEVTIIVGGITKFVNVILGFKILDAKIANGLKSLITNGIHLSLTFGATSGLGVIISILYQLQDTVDLTKILGNVIQNPQDLLELSVQLDGGYYVGIAGIVAVIYNVQLYAAKKISLEALIDIIIQVEASNTIQISKARWNRLVDIVLQIIQAQSQKFNTGAAWSSLSKFFQDIKNEKLVIGGINVSAIINVLIATSGNVSVTNLIKVLIELKVVASIAVIISTLYLRIIWFIISGQGLVFIAALFPTITISIDFSSSVSIVKQIISSVQISQLTKYIITLDIVGIITHLPVLGGVFRVLEESLKAAGIAAQVSLTSALKETSSVTTVIKNWVWFALGLGGNQPSGGIAGLASIGGGVSVSASSSWTSSLQVSSSSSSSGSVSGGTSSSVSGGTSRTSAGTTKAPSKGSGSGGWSFGFGFGK